MIDDLHGLQDRAGTQLAVTGAGGEEHQLLDSHGLDRFWDRKLEVPPEVADGVTLHVFDEAAVPRQIEAELVVLEKPTGSLRAGEIEPVPVDYRAAAQNEAERLYVVQREVLDALQPS